MATQPNREVLTLPIASQFLFTFALEDDVVLDVQGQVVAYRPLVSLLAIDSITRDAQGLTLSWRAFRGQTYSVESSSDLSAWESAAEVVADREAMSWTAAPPDSYLYYRLRY